MLFLLSSGLLLFFVYVFFYIVATNENKKKRSKIVKWIYFPLDIDNIRNCTEIEMFPKVKAKQKHSIKNNTSSIITTMTIIM